MTASIIAPMFLAMLGGYLLGTIPFGLLLTRLAGLGDIRAIGSGNIGATNVLRTGNKGLAAATLVLDALKGTASVLWLAPLINVQWVASASPGAGLQGHEALALQTAIAAGLGAFLGHLYPVWLRFKGGKGVATYIGVLLGLAWQLALLFCALWLLTALVTRYSSLSALVASLVVPIAAYALAGPLLATAAVVMTMLLVWKHAANISRLLAGQEPRIGSKT